MWRWVKEGIYSYRLGKAVQLYQEAGCGLARPSTPPASPGRHDLMADFDAGAWQ